jgi:hypothetical protein
LSRTMADPVASGEVLGPDRYPLETEGGGYGFRDTSRRRNARKGVGQ